MNDTITKTYRVAIIERALAYFEVEAASPRDAAENWADGEFRDRDDEALDTEGPTIVRERQPDGTWRRVPSSEWEDELPGTDAVAPQLLAACRMVVERWEHGDLAAAARACAAAVAAAERCPAEPSMGGRFVIQSAEEDAYWSNGVGWTGPEEATTFTTAERDQFHLPIGGQWAAAQPYSVLLLYPDHVNDGNETYYAFVLAADPVAAVAEARRQALATNEWTAEDVDPAGFVPLLVIDGHHRGLPTSHD